jgi:hypothetical protein
MNKILIQLIKFETPDDDELDSALSQLESSLIDKFQEFASEEEDPIVEGGTYTNSESEECIIWMLMNLNVSLAEIDDQLMDISNEYEDMIAAFDFTNFQTQKYSQGEYDTGNFSDPEGAENYEEYVKYMVGFYKEPPEGCSGGYPEL